MRKTRVLAVVVASLVSAASFAQAQSAAPAPQAGRHAMRGGMRGERGHGGVLKGIKLSDTEKAKLKEIHGRYAPENKKLFESMKPAMQEARALRQKGDTAGARAVLERNKAGRDQFKALRDREQADVRAALSPENQKQFDLNVQEQAKRRADWESKGGKQGGRRGHGERGANG
jgi:Spy/CpxP family protein refolding chaperone